jgi:L-rhamnose mutarotase
MAEIKRVGMVIGVRDECIPDYTTIHADEHPGVRDLLARANMHNFSIFIKQFPDGKHYLFGYYEYTGIDYDADMQTLAGEQRNIEWLAMTDPMQIPFPGEKTWSIMDQVYFGE